jgi:asparagine synthase (glutamine-hydrolysing)
MCGIAGIVNLNGEMVNPSMLYSMCKIIAHRGPDDEGYALVSSLNCKQIQYSGPASNKNAQSQMISIQDSRPQPTYDIGFAHRRFSIIDLSDAGHQPLSTSDSRWSMIYNGEIYNYKELRAELEITGTTFYTQTDTEVVLAAYQKWGVSCFNKFNGFWALAIFDPDKKCVIISRDRMGVKPLYFMYHNDCFIFASEMKALLSLTPNDNRTLNSKVAEDWLRFGLKDHTSETFFFGIKSFPQASYAYIMPQKPLDIQRFWSLPVKRKNYREYPIAKAIEELRSILTDAIKIRLRADVPLAIQLSGGVDSSAIAAISKHELNVALPAYTVKFPDPEADEEPYARIVADSCCSEYKIVNSPSGSIWQDIDKFTWLHEEPYHSPNLYIDQQVLSIMRKDGIKVALNGAAGDENFGGYGHHFTLMQLQRLVKLNLSGYIKSAFQSH